MNSDFSGCRVEYNLNLGLFTCKQVEQVHRAWREQRRDEKSEREGQEDKIKKALSKDNRKETKRYRISVKSFFLTFLTWVF